MSKSTLSINVKALALPDIRTVKVPCRLPESFTFTACLARFGTVTVTAYVKDGLSLHVSDFEMHGEKFVSPPLSEAEGQSLHADAERVLSEVMAFLTAPGGPVLTSIALAYEAEVDAYDLAISAHATLPRAIVGDAMYWKDPRNGADANSPAVLMLGKYVDHVFEQACKAQTERAEQAAEGAK